MGWRLTEARVPSLKPSRAANCGKEWHVLTRLRIAPLLLGIAGLVVVGVLVWQGITEHGAPPAPTDPDTGLSRGTVILNSGILVFREGLEVILVLAAITASLQGGNQSYRRPIAAGAGVALLATVAT